MELLFVFKLFIVFCMEVNMLEFEFEKGFVMNFLVTGTDFLLCLTWIRLIIR